MRKGKRLVKFLKSYGIETLDDITSDVVQKIYSDSCAAKERTKKVLVAILLLSVYSALVASLLSYKVYRPIPPHTILADGKGGFKRIIPIINPRVNVRQASAWAAKRSSELLSLHFKKYPAQIRYYKSFFIGDGGAKYFESLEENGILGTLAKDKLIITAIHIGEPKRIRKYLVDGKVNWAFHIPMIQTIQGMSDKHSTQKRVVGITVQEASRDVAIEGLQIRSFHMVR